MYLPPILPQSDSLHSLLWDAHFYLAFAFFALILLHLSAALFHALVRRDGVFATMASGVGAARARRSLPPMKECSPNHRSEARLLWGHPQYPRRIASAPARNGKYEGKVALAICDRL